FIEVRRAVVRRQITSTKTHKIRRVDLSPQLSQVLREVRETRDLEAKLQERPMPEWVFVTPHGGRMTIEVVRKGFEACLQAAGLRLGHGSISITLDVYSHLFQGEHRHHVHRLDDPQTVPFSSESATQLQPTKNGSEAVSFASA